MTSERIDSALIGGAIAACIGPVKKDLGAQVVAISEAIEVARKGVTEHADLADEVLTAKQIELSALISDLGESIDAVRKEVGGEYAGAMAAIGDLQGAMKAQRKALNDGAAEEYERYTARIGPMLAKLVGESVVGIREEAGNLLAAAEESMMSAIPDPVQGAKGERGEGFRWRGDHDPGESDYRARDIAKKHGSTWLCVKDGAMECPGDGWELFAQRGSRGKAGHDGMRGAKGERGMTGPPGPVGPPGASVLWRGRFRVGSTYRAGDIVNYDQGLWIAKRETEAVPKAGEDWDVVISRQSSPDLSGYLTMAHLAEPDPHPQYMLPEELPQTGVLYLSVTPNGSDYSLLLSRGSLPQTAIITSVNASDVLCGRFRREEPIAQDVLYAELETRVVLSLGGEADETFVYCKAILKKGVDDTEIVLGTSTPLVLYVDPGLYTFQIQILGPVQAVIGDTIIIEVYGSKSGGGPDREVTIYVDGGYSSRSLTYLPIPAYPAAHGETHAEGGSDPIPGVMYEAYGQMQMDLPTAFPDLGVAYQKINLFDSTSLSASVGVTIDLGNDSFSVDGIGIFMITLVLSFSHDEVNAGRVTNVRLFNETKQSSRKTIPVPAGRNQAYTFASVTAIFEADSDVIGDAFIMQIGDGDAYSAVEFQFLDLSIVKVGEISA